MDLKWAYTRLSAVDIVGLSWTSRNLNNLRFSTQFPSLAFCGFVLGISPSEQSKIFCPFILAGLSWASLNLKHLGFSAPGFCWFGLRISQSQELKIGLRVFCF